MASQWQWLWDYERQAYIEGNEAQLHLASFRRLASAVSHDLPEEKLAAYEAGRQAALHLNEPWWEMFYEHWVIEVLLFGTLQPRLALDRAVRAVFQTSKPIYAHFPQRISLQMNLAAAYSALDPIGYEAELRALFKHIEEGCAGQLENHTYYLQLWGHFLEVIENPAAIEVAAQYLRSAQEYGIDHHIGVALNMLCIALVRFDPEMARLQLRELAVSGEEIAWREDRNGDVTEYLMWRALAERWNGNEAEAQRLYHRSMAMQTRLPKPRNNAHFGAMAFHEAGGELEKSLQICQVDIRILANHDLTFHVAQRRLEKCRLLSQLGRGWLKDANRLRRVAENLKSRSHWERQIKILENREKEKSVHG